MQFIGSALARNLLSAAVVMGSMTAVGLFIGQPYVFEWQAGRAVGGDGPEATLPSPRENPETEGQSATSNEENFGIAEGAGPAEGAGAIVPGIGAEAALGDAVTEGLAESIPADPVVEEAPEEPFLAIEYMAGGTVFDAETGEVLTGKALFVEVLSGGVPPRAVKTVVNPETGRFELSGLPFGSVQLLVSAEGYLPAARNLAVPLEGALIIGLVRGGTVRIRVTDEFSRRLKKVRFFLPGWEGHGAPVSLIARSEGGLHVLKGLEEGDQKLLLAAEGYEVLSMDVRVSREEAHTYWAVLDAE